ncbi:MAG: hypothetical protein PHO10_11345 [Gemmiger sp.]|nr:hypothetical protein [Gemmiger sp.]
MKQKILSAIRQRVLILAEWEENDCFREIYLNFLSALNREIG